MRGQEHIQAFHQCVSFIAISFLWRRLKTSSCGMPLPSANSRREMLMSRASSIWSKTLSRNSASTRYEAARPFWVMRTGRRVSRTRAIYVERLLRHSEKGITSSDGRQRRSGISSVFGMASSPFAFCAEYCTRFCPNFQVRLTACPGLKNENLILIIRGARIL